MNFLTIGRIVNTVGIKGDLKIVSFSDFSKKRYKIGNSLLLRNEDTGQEQTVIVNSYRTHKGLDIVMFEGIDGVSATSYIGWYVLGPKDAIKLPKDTYFHVDLVGCSVNDEDNNKLGSVIKVKDFGAHPILIVKREDETTFQVPFVPFFLRKVDIDTRTITIHVIEGLL
jgi:16S rRNA processing protein RimM